MQLVSIRLPVELIEDLKTIGKLEGMGYQSLAREVLNRFVEAENRKRINDHDTGRRDLNSCNNALKIHIRQQINLIALNPKTVGST